MPVLVLVNVLVPENVNVNRVNMHMLDHEKLDIYKVSIEFMAIAINIADNIPRAYYSLADQLKERGRKKLYFLASSLCETKVGL